MIYLLPAWVSRLNKSEWAVRPVTLGMARRMVIEYHYAAGGSNTAVDCFGLFRAHEVMQFGAKCYGITWWIPPTRDAAVATYPGNPNGVLALSRMAIHPDAPRNAASFLLMRSVKQLDSRWECLVTYADQWQGHTGAIYRASNWQYIGLTDPEWVYVNKQGRMMSRKRGDHTFNHQQMLDMGFIAKGPYSKHKFVFIRPIKKGVATSIIVNEQMSMFPN